MKNVSLQARVVVRTSKGSSTQGDFVVREVALNFEHVRMAAICRATNRSEISGCSHARFAVAVKSPFDRSSCRALCVNEPKHENFTSLFGRLRQKACRTRNTIIFPHSTNQIIDLWRCLGRYCRHFFNSLCSCSSGSSSGERQNHFTLESAGRDLQRARKIRLCCYLRKFPCTCPLRGKLTLQF